ncbi:lysophospholipid acyltransferase family protein [Amycolatopsis anabasis]|uniref:lysophospholipid acyltransferase family protein n=1 Tax=Amycolatopsis anabasis TaxID=1840409 RepID=UPI00131D05AA|nr:lysophospholipid acyltransferase family protein [Amycolatopsis anabasis]
MSRHLGEEGKADIVTTSTSAQVIPLHGPGREKPQRDPVNVPEQDVTEAERTADAPVIGFPGTAERVQPADAEETLASLPPGVRTALNFLRNRLTGDYTVDEFGFDAELTETLLLPPLRVLYEKWFRVTAHGVHNLPESGGALLVCNHSGTLPLDALMTAVAVHDEHPAHRYLRGLGADLVFQLPLVGALARKSGQTLACNPDAERLLRTGELVGVWPEGFKGIGKPFASRYKLQRFGRGGFVAAALRAQAPIIPVSIVGAEEIYPKIGDLKPLARLLGLPYFPVTPFFPLLGPLGAIPLPTKWHIEFGEPIRTDEFSAEDKDDPMLVFNLTDQVRESIQHTLYQRLTQRRGIFKG